MPVYLVPADHPDSPVPVDKPVLLIGRQAECDVILTCSRKVSRRHCCVVQISDWFVVRDLGSTNGIAVNGDRIANEAKFDLGDTLTVGDVDFEVVEGKFDVPKGKVCIGPALKANKNAGGDRQKPADRGKPSGRAENFRGIPASRPRRDGVREIDRDDRRQKPERPTSDDPAERVTAAANRGSGSRGDEHDPDNDRMVPDEFGSDTFGSDIENEELIAETFGSDMQDAYDPAAGIAGVAKPVSLDDPDDDAEAFRFADSDDELDNEPVAPVEKLPRRRRGRDQGTLDPFDGGEVDGGEADDPSNDELVFEDDEPVSRPKPKRRKSRPRDESLKDDERLDVESAVDEIKRSPTAQDSIIELDEFDLLD